jgi:isopenicillin-N epimerase
VPVESTDEIVARFAAAITPRTRVILMSHIINLTGQVLPVREVVRMARARGVLVVVDGAHGFAQLPCTRESLDCDIYATSLHKWLGAPHGTGFLYVRRERIGEIWPLYPAPVELRENIRKYESIGSVAAAPHLGIRPALDFWLAIGAERKMARLRWLRDRWLHAFLDDPTVTIHTPRSADFSAALVTIDFAGISAGEVGRLALGTSPHLGAAGCAQGVSRYPRDAQFVYDGRGTGSFCGNSARGAHGWSRLVWT